MTDHSFSWLIDQQCSRTLTVARRTRQQGQSHLVDLNTSTGGYDDRGPLLQLSKEGAMRLARILIDIAVDMEDEPPDVERIGTVI